MDETRWKSHYADKFGMPETSIRYWDELTAEQQEGAKFIFGNVNLPGKVYAVTASGNVFARRDKHPSDN